jgi:hypothetical protein
MRIMVMHKVDAHMEAGDPPSQEILRGMGQLVGQSLKSGVFLDGAGLHRSAQRVRLRFAGGTPTQTSGPYPGENELVAGVAMVRTRSIDEAIEVASRIAAVDGDGEIEIGPVVEPWDLGVAPRPAALERQRYLLVRKADPANEAGAAPTPERLAARARLLGELTKEGVLLTAEGLAPSAEGARLPAGPKGKRHWIDGPFAESKELIAGFSILAVGSRAEAIAWADRYAAVLDGNEVDVRPLR